jgi:hypothetical protein
MLMGYVCKEEMPTLLAEFYAEGHNFSSLHKALSLFAD